MWRKTLIVSLLLGGLLWWPAMGADPLWPAAERPVHIDDAGVLQWSDTQEEVALFGVNYYTPFWHNFPDLQKVGADHKQVIDQDVLHFARLGLDAIRLHVFDRELSDAEGNLLSNEHLDLLDYLIGRAKERGIYTVLTPIAWWPVPGDSPGFSTRFTMPQMTTDPASRPSQINYLKQFVTHVNPYTGLAYKDDPAVVCLELINEPLYPDKTTDQQVTEYINVLADAIRAAGCTKPLFYNGWGKRLQAVNAARVDGSSFGWYPSGLVAGRSLKRNFLPAVNTYGGSNDWNPSMRDSALAHKAKIIYEFDAADIPGSYMYPAMARSFRSGGAQIATQFQYDPLPLAPYNQGWQTHFLNLVGCPQKAVSFLIASEAFHALPRLQDYGPYPESCRFGAGRVSYEEDLSEWVTDDAFLYSNSTRTTPPHPESLQRIVGCGDSPLVQYAGTGAYFLEKLTPGTWRLEVYPDAVWVADPYGPNRLDREVVRIVWRERPLRIRLADLGDEYRVRAWTTANSNTAKWETVTSGEMRVTPGVYLLQRQDVVTDAWRQSRLSAHIGLDEFVALPASPAEWAVRHEPQDRWRSDRDLPIRCTVAGDREPQRVAVTLLPDKDGAIRQSLLQAVSAYDYAGTIPADWLKPGDLHYALDVEVDGVNKRFSGGDDATGWTVRVADSAAPILLFDAEYDHVRFGGDPFQQRLTRDATEGRILQVSVERFGPAPSAVSFRHEMDEVANLWRDKLAACNTLCVRARAREATTTAAELVLIERDGAAWGTNVPLTTEWQDIRIPLDSLRYFHHWGETPGNRGSESDRIRPAEVTGVSVCFGAWLYPNHFAEPHQIEVRSIALQ
jgi:hypothetical protein